MIEIKQQYSHNKKIIDGYVISYGVMQSVQSSCDTIDFFKISEKKYGFYLADVAGSSSESIKVMHELQGLINKYCLVNNKNELKDRQHVGQLVPVEVVKHVNQEMYQLKLNKYVTLIYGFLDLETNVFDYTVAGHYPNPILINAKLEAHYIHGKGYPLGLVQDSQFEKFNVLVEEGSSLIFFSDGILRFLMSSKDQMNNHSISKENQLLELLSGIDYPIEVNKILQKMNLTYSTPIVDDIVILTIQRNNSNL